MDWENHLEKKPIQKLKKICKNQSEIAACEQKTTSEKASFCSNTVFSLYFEIRAKKFHVAKPLAFSLRFLFQHDRNHYSNFTSKIMKMCSKPKNFIVSKIDTLGKRLIFRKFKFYQKDIPSITTMKTIPLPPSNPVILSNHGGGYLATEAKKIE